MGKKLTLPTASLKRSQTTVCMFLTEGRAECAQICIQDSSSDCLPFQPEPHPHLVLSTLPRSDLVNLAITVELKNDISIRGTLKSVDQYLNIKLDDIQVLDELKYPHLSSVKNIFIRFGLHLVFEGILLIVRLEGRL